MTNLKPTVVLVHGGFVDGAGWEGVYSILKKDGYDVSIVQNPTLSLAGDVAATRQVIAQANGPVVLVGHSYGGVVITEAGNDPKVSKLVYIAAFAPDKGESVASLIKDPAPGADPAAAGRLPVPRQGEVRGFLCGRRRDREGRVHGQLAGSVGRCCARGGCKRAGMEEEAQLVSGCGRRQDDPTPSAALHVRACRRNGGGERGKPCHLRVAAGGRCFPHQEGCASVMGARATAAGRASPAAEHV